MILSFMSSIISPIQQCWLWKLISSPSRQNLKYYGSGTFSSIQVNLLGHNNGVIIRRSITPPSWTLDSNLSQEWRWDRAERVLKDPTGASAWMELSFPPHLSQHLRARSETMWKRRPPMHTAINHRPRGSKHSLMVIRKQFYYRGYCV